MRNLETEALVVQEAKGDFTLQPVILDEVRPDELLIEMKYSGICHSDLVAQQGLLMVGFPAILGHEGAGYVREIGSAVKDQSLKVGDAVLLSFSSCGTCKPCTNNRPVSCPSNYAINLGAVRTSDGSMPARTKEGVPVRSQFFGQSSFARMSVVNERSVVKCPNPDKMNLYAPLGCGVQTGAGTVLNVLKPGPDDSIAIFGLGTVGLSALMAAKHLGVKSIIAIDVVDEKLDVSKELGATVTINSRNSKNIVEDIHKITDGGVQYAIDCTGKLPVIEDMVACVGLDGTATMVGVPPPDSQIKIDPLKFTFNLKRLVAVGEGESYPPVFIPQLIDLHQQGRFPLERICRTYPIENFADAIHDLHAGKVVKPVIQWN
ncbi:hypothetical protein NX059_009772 [Plenodomus lindquistii]|nr:hypothetical protein NX059_009772 [Plenodomus lindquistii]